MPYLFPATLPPPPKSHLISPPPPSLGCTLMAYSFVLQIYQALFHFRVFLVAQTVKHLPTMRETRVWSLGREDALKEMATHSSSLAWKIPWTEDSGRLQSMGSQRVDTTEQLYFIPFQGHFQSILVFKHSQLPTGISLIGPSLTN